MSLLLGISIPLGCLLYFIAFSFVVAHFQLLGYAKGCVSTEKFVRSSWFGLIVYVYGQIGAGKTTCASGITNLLTKIKKEQALEKIDLIKDKLPEVNFNKVNKIINDAFYDGHLTNSDTIVNLVYSVYPELEKLCEGKFYNNYLYPESYSTLIKDYIYAYIAIIRNNYVYFLRRKFFSWNTNNWAMKFLPDMIDIKDRFVNLDYKIQHYTTIFEDEKILSGKRSTEFMVVSKDDGGGDAFLRLIRQLGKETIHYVTTLQDFNRSVKQERELATGIIHIQKRNQLTIYSLANLFRKMILDFLQRWKIFLDDFIQSIYNQKTKKLEKHLKVFEEQKIEVPGILLNQIKKYDVDVSSNPSKIKAAIKKLINQEEKNFADSFLNYEANYYTSADDVGKPKKECVSGFLKLNLCFPLSWCYGSIDTYSFSALDDFLSNHSYDFNDYYDPANNSIPNESEKEFRRNMFKILMKNKDDINEIEAKFEERLKEKEKNNLLSFNKYKEELERRNQQQKNTS